MTFKNQILLSLCAGCVITLSYIELKPTIINNIVTKLDEYEKSNQKINKELIYIADKLYKNENSINLKIGDLYFNGKSVHKDLNQAKNYYSRVNTNESKYKMYEIYKETDIKKAFSYLQDSVFNGYSDNNAIVKLADMFLNGNGTYKDELTAIVLYEKALNIKQDADIELKLADLYLNNKLEEKFKFKSFDYYMKSAKFGNSKAQYNLAVLYYEGSIIEKNYELSENWFLEAYKNNNADAALNLGINYKDGVFGKKIDYEKAVFYFNEAIKLGNIKAKYYLGEMYYKGYGVDKDVKKGETLLNELIGTEYEPLASVKLLTFSDTDGTKKLIKNAYESIEKNLKIEEDAQKVIVKLDKIDSKKDNLFIKIEPDVVLKK